MNKATNRLRSYLENKYKDQDMLDVADLAAIAILDLADAVRSIEAPNLDGIESSINDLSTSLEKVLGELSANVGDIDLSL